MKRMYLNISVVFFLLVLSSAHGEAKDTERFMLVTVRDLDGTSVNQIMSKDEYMALAKEIRSDNRMLNHAYTKVRKEWQEEQEKTQTGKKDGKQSKKQPFPLKKPQPKQVSCRGIFNSKEEAEEKKAEYDQKETKRLEREKLAEEKKLGRMSEEKRTAYKNELEQQAELLGKLHNEIINMKPEQEKEGGLIGPKREIKRLGEGIKKELKK